MICSILVRSRLVAAFLAVAWLVGAQAEAFVGPRGAGFVVVATMALLGEESEGKRNAAALPNPSLADQTDDPDDEPPLRASSTARPGRAGRAAATRVFDFERVSGVAQATGPPET